MLLTYSVPQTRAPHRSKIIMIQYECLIKRKRKTTQRYLLSRRIERVLRYLFKHLILGLIRNLIFIHIKYFVKSTTIYERNIIITNQQTIFFHHHYYNIVEHNSERCVCMLNVNFHSKNNMNTNMKHKRKGKALIEICSGLHFNFI